MFIKSGTLALLMPSQTLEIMLFYMICTYTLVLDMPLKKRKWMKSPVIGLCFTGKVEILPQPSLRFAREEWEIRIWSVAGTKNDKVRRCAGRASFRRRPSDHLCNDVAVPNIIKCCSTEEHDLLHYLYLLSVIAETVCKDTAKTINKDAYKTYATFTNWLG